MGRIWNHPKVKLWKTIKSEFQLELEDKKLSRKRLLIESVFNLLKNHMNLEHTRHRSPVNFLVHIIDWLTRLYNISNEKLLSFFIDIDTKGRYIKRPRTKKNHQYNAHWSCINRHSR